MPTLVLAACGPDPIDSDDALCAVLGYARAQRWLLVQTPSHSAGHWVEVPAYPFSSFDAQPASSDPGFSWADVLAPDGLLGPLPLSQHASFSAELHALSPAVDAALAAAAGQPFWELDDEQIALVDAVVTTARQATDPDRVMAALHHKHPRLMPLTSTKTERALRAVAHVQSTTLCEVIRADLQANRPGFDLLEREVTARLGVRLSGLRLHDLILWLTVTHRWPHAAEAAEEQVGQDDTTYTH